MSQKSLLDKAIKQGAIEPQYKYSLCTLMSDPVEYQEMMQSFIDAGFSTDDCEYRYIDNSKGNSFDGYTGLNLFLQEALGQYIILCHQDILLDFDKRVHLEVLLKELDDKDPDWAIVSNAGGIENSLFRRVAHNVYYPENPEKPEGQHHYIGRFPQRSISADESFILVKKSANLSLSHDLDGFHLYGLDLCLIAELLGYTSYVINFKITHKSYGNPGESFGIILDRLITKYKHFMRSRRVLTTITDFYLSTSAFKTRWAESWLAKKISRKTDKYITRRKKDNNY